MVFTQGESSNGIAETIRVLLFITLSIIVSQFYLVTAMMIVLLALLNDFPIMIIGVMSSFGVLFFLYRLLDHTGLVFHR
ncbi:MAG: hypothetical protein HXS46_10345 [Theionarchaea archaeon]|nr:hypothetical protein [Theionarchaea archaeon]